MSYRATKRELTTELAEQLNDIFPGGIYHVEEQHSRKSGRTRLEVTIIIPANGRPYQTMREFVERIQKLGVPCKFRGTDFCWLPFEMETAAQVLGFVRKDVQYRDMNVDQAKADTGAKAD